MAIVVFGKNRERLPVGGEVVAGFQATPVEVPQKRKLLTLGQVLGRNEGVERAANEARRKGRKFGEARALLNHHREEIRFAAEAGANHNGDPDFIVGVVEGERRARLKQAMVQAGGRLLVRTVKSLRKRQ